MKNSKRALVTGSTSGIGLATARVLASHGIDIVLNGLEPQQEGDELARELAGQYAVNTLYCPADLSRPEKIRQMMSDIGQAGGINILVNNAGIQFTSPLLDFPAEKWDQIMAINLSAAFHTTQQALPMMLDDGWGRIINIASVHGLVASLHKSAYCAAKHGLIGLTKVVALEQAANNITANAICPGWTDTPLLNDQFKAYSKQHGVTFDEAKLGLIQSKAPYPRLVAPSEIGELAYFLCTDAARAITGTSMPIDGAWTAH